MYEFRAIIQLTSRSRKKPLQGNCYRPILVFSPNILRSALLIISDGEFLDMDSYYENRTFRIYSYKDLDVYKEFTVDREFTILDATSVIGYGKITEIIGEVI